MLMVQPFVIQALSGGVFDPGSADRSLKMNLLRQASVRSGDVQGGFPHRLLGKVCKMVEIHTSYHRVHRSCRDAGTRAIPASGIFRSADETLPH